MHDELKEFSEIEDVSSIDFSGDDWSWGFGYDKHDGYLYHITAAGYVTAYEVPPFMVVMITQVREGALSNLKRRIARLDDQRMKLLAI